MLQKTVSVMLIVFVNLIGVSQAFAANGKADTEKDARMAAKVKESVARFGTGEAARMKIKLKDKRKIEGYVSEINQDSFIVKDFATGEKTAVAYAQVKKAKGNNLSTGAKIAIGVGVVLAIIIAVVLLTAEKTCADDSCF